jgi:methionyl aminopeptidase
MENEEETTDLEGQIEPHMHSHSHPELSEEEQSAKELENFRKAGKLTASVLEDAKRLILPGESLLDVVESIEKMIFDAGGKPAFPANISINDIAAHFTPESDNKDLIGEKDIVKIDLGVHVDGCIGDTAFTVDLSGEHGKLLEASQAALDAAIAGIKPGVTTGEIGGMVEEEMKKRGFRPIENLTGHMIRPYMLHAGISVPNIKTHDAYEFTEGDIFAIEPFSTDGAGRVADTSQVEIFSIEQPRNVRLRQSRMVLNHVIETYFTLPFAERWLEKKFERKLLLNAALRELMNAGVLHPYPVLREAAHGKVAQFEHTLLVTKDGCEILTKK